jgi:hypothetical protein
VIQNALITAAFWITLLLLLLAACVLFLAAGWRQRQASAGDRDRFIFRQFAQTLMIEALIEAIAIASAGLPLPPACGVKPAASWMKMNNSVLMRY